MKIVQINCSSNGSTGTLARAIHEALRERGDESRFFYGIGPDAGEGTQAICTPLECRLHTYAGRITGLHGYFSHLRTKELLRRLDETAAELRWLGMSTEDICEHLRGGKNDG